MLSILGGWSVTLKFTVLIFCFGTAVELSTKLIFIDIPTSFTALEFPF